MPSGNNTFSGSSLVGIQQRRVAPHSLQSPQLQPQEQHGQNRQAVQGHEEQRRLSQPSDVSDACQYLYFHRIHAKVENIFSSLLNDRPEDPLLYILEYLRKKNVKVSVDEDEEEEEHCVNDSVNVILGRNGIRQPSESTPTPHEGEELTDKDVCVREGVVEVPCGEEKVLTNVEGETRRHFVPLLPIALSDDTPVPMEVEMPSTSCSAENGRFVVSPAEQCVQPIQRCFVAPRTAVSLVRPASSLLALRTSVRSSCNDVSHGSTNLRFGGTFSEAQFNALGGAAASLDREDSSRSDMSMFSLASVDMQDFLQEFRSAKADCVGLEARLVDIETVSEILQRITMPLLDVALIAELFDDVKKINDLRYSTCSGFLGEEEDKSKDRQHVSTKTAVSLSGATTEAGSREWVYFDAFLARMAFMIQGRYPTELVRDTFYSILKHAAPRKRSAAGAVRHCQQKKLQQPQQQQQQQQQQSRGTEEEVQRTVSSSGSGYGKSIGLSSKNVCINDCSAWLGGGGGGYSATATMPATATQTYPGLSVPKSAPCAAHSTSHTAAELSTLLHGVPLAVCVEEGLWRGLGIPASRTEVVLALRTLGIPEDEDYEFHVNDFVRLVMALTGHSSVHSAGDRGSLLLFSSFGRDNAIVPLNESMRGNSA